MISRAWAAVTQPWPGSSHAASEAPVATSSGTTSQTRAAASPLEHPEALARPFPPPPPPSRALVARSQRSWSRVRRSPVPRRARALGVEAVHHGGDRGGVRGEGQAAHAVLDDPPEHASPRLCVTAALLLAAVVDRGDRTPQPGHERPLRHRPTVTGGREDRFPTAVTSASVRAARLRGDLQRPVQRGLPGSQGAHHGAEPARRGRQTQPPGDLTDTDPGRQRDLLGHHPFGRHHRRHPNRTTTPGQGLDLLHLDRVQCPVRREQVCLHPCLGHLELLDLRQHLLAGSREPCELTAAGARSAREGTCARTSVEVESRSPRVARSGASDCTNAVGSPVHATRKTWSDASLGTPNGPLGAAVYGTCAPPLGLCQLPLLEHAFDQLGRA